MNRAPYWENWRFQVNSGWTRSNYFAVVETLALSGTWVVLNQPKRLTAGLFFAFLGLLSSIIWLLNDLINHAYIRHWWRLANEKNIPEPVIGKWWDKPLGFKYSHLMHVIPIIFVLAWLRILACFIPPVGWRYAIEMAVGAVATWVILAIIRCVSKRTE